MTYLYVRQLLTLLKDRKGISSLEYGVLAAGIISLVAAGALTVGNKMTTVFASIVTALG